MPPTVKNPLRQLISSVFPMSVLNALGSDAGSKSVPVANEAMPIVVWVQLIMALLRPWSSESRAVWTELTEYRISRLHICKSDNHNEHEYVIIDLSRNEHKQHLFLRLERSAGERKNSPSSSPSSSSPSESSAPCRDFYMQRLPGSSISVSSVKEGIAKMTGSLRRATRRLSDSSLSRSSRISSNQYMAADTVERIEKFQLGKLVVRTIEFTSIANPKRPSLWDLMILAYVVHEDGTTYELFDRQCFWFADTISAILEKWSKTPTDEATTATTTTTTTKGKSRFLKRNKSPGSVGIFVVHQRKPDVIDKIWGKFLKQREDMNAERQEYENARAEELRKAEELARELAEVKKGQGEKERRLRKEQDERDRLHQEEQRLLRQQIIDQERGFRQRLEENNREWEMRLQKKDRETDRRFQELEHLMRMSNSGQTQLHTPAQPAQPQGRS